MWCIMITLAGTGYTRIGVCKCLYTPLCDDYEYHVSNRITIMHSAQTGISIMLTYLVAN